MKNLTFASALCASITLFVTSGTPAVADAGTAVAALVQDVRDKKARDFETLKKEPPGQLLIEVRRYFTDPSSDVRMEAVSMASWIAKNTQNRGVREQAMRLLFEVAAGHEDAGLYGFAASLLRQFSSVEFTDDMRQVLATHITSKHNAGQINPEAVLLAGIAEVQALAPWLRQLAGSGNWTAQLALARMGDPAAIQSVVGKARSETDVVRRLTSLDDLAFIRQPQAVEVLVILLFSDERTPGNGSDVPSSKYSQRAVDYLAQILKDFPVKATGFGSDAEVEIARQWIVKQGGTAKLKIKR